MKLKTYKQFKRETLKQPGVKKAYNDLDFEFRLIEAIINQRLKKKMTQSKLADKIGTKQSAIARFESGYYNPTLSFLKKLTKGLGLKLLVK